MSDLLEKQWPRLGTRVSLSLRGPSDPERVFLQCGWELERIESTYSRFLKDSELSQLNEHLNVWQDASEEMVFLLESAGRFHKQTAGFFDVGVKETLDRLGYDAAHSFAPKEKPKTGLLEKLKESFSADAVLVDLKKNKVLLKKPIDFGGFGKGYALDRLAGILDSAGVRHFCVNAGGDVFCRKEPSERPWTLLLEHPDDPEKAIGTLDLDGQALAASAANRRRWGRGLHHLINPKTKQPAQGVKAVFVLARTGMEADAYAKAVFTAGFEEGIRISRKLGVEVLSISEENRFYESPGFNAKLFS